MKKDWYDKYGKEFHCADCTFLDSCLNKDAPLYSRCCEQYLRDRIAELEEQLAEKERQILELQEQSIRDNQIYNEELAEKEKGIEVLKQRLKDTIKIYSDDFVEKDKELKELRYKVSKADQDKISLAVERLENVKDFVKEKERWEIEGSDYSIVYADDILDQIDKQIEELKKENR